jgi:hypothetical protein
VPVEKIRSAGHDFAHFPGYSCLRGDTVLTDWEPPAQGEEHMDHKENLEVLLAGDLAESEMDQLRKFRRDYNEKQKQEALADQRRLEFVRWMVTNNRLTEELA